MKNLYRKVSEKVKDFKESDFYVNNSEKVRYNYNKAVVGSIDFGYFVKGFFTTPWSLRKENISNKVKDVFGKIFARTKVKEEVVEENWKADVHAIGKELKDSSLRKGNSDYFNLGNYLRDKE